ncbi:TonB-dependent receptor [Sphingobium phenoxybenzoativorans]|uniref:TonB-dependent receptor n=1 Tax=Sphingobium phenoxybenzoativorans TaxID=1592790 RepID=A0A975KB17_9SPHN|nr:TonB-dependent receptor [Sphingobium phenoxybenzoativorans]QUT06682.1 TonB-dependent receptor [Sphingobium phenoxybenzoativorans]
MSRSSSRGALRHALLGAISLGAAIAGLSGAAHAQEAAAEADAGDAIIVTATRREELAKDVPIAVTAIGGEKLDVLNSSGLDIRFLSARTPSLQIESSFGRTFPRFYIRGLGNTDFDPNSAQPVSVVYDDVALESPMLKSFPVFDLASVEVLRGPQGTLFGRNTPAGVVKLNSKRPDFDSYSGYAKASWATYNSVNAEAAVGGPIGEGLAFRLSGLLQRRDDWVTNDNAGNGFADAKLEGYRDMAGRFQLGFESGDFKAFFNVHGRDLNGSPRVFRAGIFQVGSNKFVPGFDKDHVSLDGFTSQSLTQWGTNLRMEVALPGVGTFFSTTGYERAKVESTGDIDGGGCYPYTGCTFGALGVGTFDVNTGGITKPREFSQELRFATEDMNGVRLQAGGYFFHQDLSYTELSYTLAGTLNGFIIHQNKNDNFGLFGSGEIDVSDALTLRGGVRLSRDEKRDLISLDPSVDSVSGQLIAVDLPMINKATASNVSWDASATYKLTDQVNVYARVATGYLGPAIQDRVTFFSVPSVAKKQTTISYEAGIKGAFTDMLSFDLAGYYSRTKDLQLTAVGGVGNSARLINVDHAIGYGVEASLEAKPIPQLALTAGFSYNFTEIRDPNAFVAVCGSGLCTPTGNTFVDSGTTFALLDGNDLPQAPRYVANVTARFGVPVGDSGEVYIFTDWAYRSAVNYFLYTAAEFRGRSLLEGGLRAGYRMDNGLEVAAFARNITNTIRAASAIDFNNLTGMINEPRIIGGEISAKF